MKNELIEKVVETIKGSEEAKNAAVEFMAQNNIELSKVDNVEFTVEEIKTGRKNKDIIEARLAEAVAKYNGVKLIMKNTETEVNYIVIGRPEDIEVTKTMVDSVKTELKSEFKKYSKNYFKWVGRKPVGTPYAEFHRNFASKVETKLVELEKTTKEKIQSMGMAPVNPRVLWMRNSFQKLVKSIH